MKVWQTKILPRNLETPWFASTQRPKLRPYKPAAGGLGHRMSVLKETSNTTGLVHGARLLLKVNQPDGFDCPGCAWPDPPAGERTAFEFCENGAKAVFAEGTKRRVEPAFFEEWAVSELMTRSDHWLELQGRLTHPMVLQPGDTHYRPIAWSGTLQNDCRQPE